MKILVVDDHQLIRSGLKNQLGSWFEQSSILEADNADGAMEVLMTSGEPDVAIIDLFLPGGDGFDLIRQIRHRCPNLPLLVLSSSKNAADIRKALGVGANGYAFKASPEEEVHAAILKIMKGGTAVPVISRTDPEPTRDSMTLEELETLLTPRQLEILTLIGRGLANKEIARHCKLSPNTVKVHVSAILDALDLANRVQASILAQGLGLCQTDRDSE